jgi:hypothetical protein
MPDYKAMYISLFNSVTDVIEMLRSTQIKSENIYVETDREAPVLNILHSNDNNPESVDKQK